MFCLPRHDMPLRDLHFTISRPTKRQLVFLGKKVGEIFAGFRKILYLCNAFKRRP